jgi:hypothetical protein
MIARRTVTATLVGMALLAGAPAAHGQALIPNPISAPGGGGLAGCKVGVSLICSTNSIVGAAGDLVGDAAQAGAGAAADAVMGGVVEWAAGGAAWLLRTIGRQVERSTRPKLASPWFSEQYASMRRIAIALSLAFLLVAITHAALRHDLQLLVRCCLVALPSSLLLMFTAVTLVQLALSVTDELAAAALASASGDVRDAFADLAKVLAPSTAAGPALPGFILFVGAVVTALLALLVWLELVLREAAVYLALAFMPLALAAAVWPRTLHWSHRLAGWLAALILAKLTIAVSFSLAAAMIVHARAGSGGFSALLAGCAVLVLAAASPWVLLRLIPFTASGGGGLHRTHVGGAVRQTPGAGVALLLARQGLSHGAASVASRGAPAAAGSRDWSPSSATRTRS